MLILLPSEHKDHLVFLTSQSTEVILDFCKLGIDFLQNGPNLKLYNSISETLNLEVGIVQNCVYGLINLLLLGCKHKLNEVDFRDSVLTLGFNSGQQSVISKFFETKKDQVEKAVDLQGIKEPHYENLEWRFEVQVASRSLQHQVTPIVLLDLALKTAKNNETGYEVSHKILQTDVNNLMHLTKELECAINKSQSRHSRKIIISLKANSFNGVS